MDSLSIMDWTTTMEHIRETIEPTPEAGRPAWFREAIEHTNLLPEQLWSTLKTVRPDPDILRRNRIAAADNGNPDHLPMDVLRTRVLNLMERHKWTSVGITSPTSGCGKTTLAINLAFSLANLPEKRTVLVDLDLKAPKIGQTMGLPDLPEIEASLRGRLSLLSLIGCCRENLAIAANRSPVAFSAELLRSTETAANLKELQQKLAPDVLIYDLPPMLGRDDVLAFLPNVDCMILVAAAGQSLPADIETCENELVEETNVLGVVLNSFRPS